MTNAVFAHQRYSWSAATKKLSCVGPSMLLEFFFHLCLAVHLMLVYGVFNNVYFLLGVGLLFKRSLTH